MAHASVIQTFLLLSAFVSILAFSASGWAQGGAAPESRPDIPEPGEDLSAFRIDSDVYGWSKDYSEMAAIGAEVKRGQKGEHRGECMLLVFPVGKIIPKHNVHVLFVTQAAFPQNPVALEDIRDRMWGIDVEYQNMWPRRPKRKFFKGAMRVEALWDWVNQGEDLCSPSVGFILRYQNNVRYQRHEIMKMSASCPDLRHTDHRIYWAKKDLAAVMIRFDYSPSDNEASIRFPLSAAWHLGQTLRLEIHYEAQKRQKVPADILQVLKQYGSVKVSTKGEGKYWGVAYREGLVYLARHIARQLGATLLEENIVDGPDILVKNVRTIKLATPLKKKVKPIKPKNDMSQYVPPYKCGGLLRDCKEKESLLP